jgi:hypothetical protein
MAKSGFVGACGEFYVAAYLSHAHYLVALPRAGIPGSDMFVSAVNRGHPIRLQVKAGTQPTKKDKIEGPIYLWSTPLSIIDAPPDNYLWFAFVSLDGWPTKIPDVFFVPSADVIARMKLVKAEIETSPKTWPYFWLRKDEAEKYKGTSGLELLQMAMANVAKM